jgi:hypothetical protein
MPNSYWIIGATLGILQVVGIIISFVGFFLIKFNDLHHLSLDVKAIKDSQIKEEEKIVQLEIGQASMRATCDERSSMYKLNKKVRARSNRQE